MEDMIKALGRCEWSVSLLIGLLLLGCIGCQEESDFSEAPNPIPEAAAAKLAAKHEPLGRHLDLRLGVGNDFSFETYQLALSNATSTSLARRSAAPKGFDLTWTVEGPGNLGGRVNVLAIDPRNEDVAYLGYSRGGLWGTRDNGETWTALTEELPFPTLGAITIDSSTGRIWIGTGDPNVSGYFYVGDGVYYSDDDGGSWQKAGLEESGVINRLLVDPRDSDVLYAAVMGRPYEANQDRGVFKTEDGGQTWTRIFFVGPEIGISDLWMDPVNPGVLYACAWPRVRTLTNSVVRGDDALLFKSADGGETWNSLYDQMGYDLPASRLGFAIAPSNPNRLYASVTGGDLGFDELYRSDDAGETWTMVCDSESPGLEIDGFQAEPFRNFGWFFGQTRVDPTDPDHVWMLGVELFESFDGGETWQYDEETDFSFFVHADKHAMEFTSSGDIWLGTDGGAYRRNLNNPLWEDVENIPTNMFYRVADVPLDTQEYSGGMQDNGTAIGGEFSTGFDWFAVFGGDGFQPTFALEEPDQMMAETQNGRLWHIDLIDFLIEEVSPPHQEESKSWDMPVASYFDEDLGRTRLLTGSSVAYDGLFENFVQWDRSPQLLVSDTSRSRLVVTAAHIAQDQTSYLGTSEGWLWKRNGFGGSWQRLTTGFTERYISDVTTPLENPNSVYITMTEYRNGNTTPYILHSEDAGLTWTSLQGDLPPLALNAVLSIPGTRDSLLVVASDAGVYASIDRGNQYHRVGTSMTNVPVFDLAYDTLDNTLIAATFGRSMQTYSLDSIDLINPATSSLAAGPRQWSQDELRVFPNPAREYFDVDVRLTEVAKSSAVMIYDAQGSLVHREVFSAGRSRLQQRIEIPATMPPGRYLVRVQNRHTSRVAPLLVL